MDTYQPIFDAVRSRIPRCDIGEAVKSALQESNLNHSITSLFNSIQQVVSEYERPSVLYRPKINQDGDVWIVLYGDNLQEGVAGVGKSPAEAMKDFDKNWTTKISVKQP